MDTALAMGKDKLAVLRQKLDQIPVLQQAEVSSVHLEQLFLMVMVHTCCMHHNVMHEFETELFLRVFVV